MNTAAHLEARGQDHTTDRGNFAERVPNVPTNHRLVWLPDDLEIRSTTCQMRDSAPNTDEITKTLIVAGGEDTIDMAVSLIQAPWEMEYKQWEVVVADIEGSIQKTNLSRVFSQTLQKAYPSVSST